MDCIFPLVEGCDQKTMDSFTEKPGMSMNQLQEMKSMMCDQAEGCDMMSVAKCNPAGGPQDKDAICRYVGKVANSRRSETADDQI